MNFLKTSLLSGISTIVKMLSSLVVNKIIAIYIGPSGIALIGQFQNFMGIITTIGNGRLILELRNMWQNIMKMMQNGMESLRLLFYYIYVFYYSRNYCFCC